ncbi:uncharacterized protein TrAFT101_007210 [Trichoderma asperellum]|uniref:uncharacterized protein n=1 Tax=Trichoderma asperellum TaxID=101201 RepID=UPI00331B912E|nr:hypothetical protein TrAFT101_007210 [Trichoderma asperellum]
MHFNQIVQLLLLFVTAALAELIPFGPIATLYNEANFQGDHFTVGRLGECVEIRSNIIGNVGSLKLQHVPSPFYVACALYSNDYCRDPAASVVWYATALFNNAYLPDTSARSISCQLNKSLP